MSQIANGRVICVMPAMACNGLQWLVMPAMAGVVSSGQQCKVLVPPVDETLEPLVGEDHSVDQPLAQRLVVH